MVVENKMIQGKQNLSTFTSKLSFKLPLLERFFDQLPLDRNDQLGWDKFCGINYDFPDNRITGQIKTHPSDFKVMEILPTKQTLKLGKKRFKLPGTVGTDGDNIHAVIQKEGIETFTLIERLSHLLGCQSNDIFIAGIKDKNAITSQRICFRNTSLSEIKKLKKLKNSYFKIKSPVYRKEGLYRGELEGNYFIIRIRNINSSRNYEKFLSTLDEIGIPNYYDHQRFGSFRPIGHVVGQCLIKNDPISAMHMFIGLPLTQESSEITAIRNEFLANFDYQKTLDELTNKNILGLKLERRLLKHLIKYHKNPVKAIYSLPRPLPRFYVRSYSSYIFNRYLSMRKQYEESFHKPLDGEKIIDDRIYAPIVGYEIDLHSIKQTSAGLILSEILEKEQIMPEDFKLEKFPSFSGKGAWRPVGLDFSHLKIKKSPSRFRKILIRTFKKLIDDEVNESLVFSLRLARGCYATMFIRHFIDIQ